MAQYITDVSLIMLIKIVIECVIQEDVHDHFGCISLSMLVKGHGRGWCSLTLPDCFFFSLPMDREKKVWSVLNAHTSFENLTRVLR